jgi:septal ring factor EnvC (AmiA/AmiB activator)
MSGMPLVLLASDTASKYGWPAAAGAIAGAAAGVLTAWIRGRAEIKKVKAAGAEQRKTLKAEGEQQRQLFRTQWQREDALRVEGALQAEAEARGQQLAKMRTAASRLESVLSNKASAAYDTDLREARELIADSTSALTITGLPAGLIDRLKQAGMDEDLDAARKVSSEVQNITP